MGDQKKTGLYGEPWRMAAPFDFPWLMEGCGTHGEATCTILANDGYGVMSVPKALAHFPVSVGDNGETGMDRAPRMIECVNALSGIPDPAATMEEVVEVLKVAQADALRERNDLIESEAVWTVPDADGVQYPKMETLSADAREELALISKKVERIDALLAKLGRG